MKTLATVLILIAVAAVLAAIPGLLQNSAGTACFKGKCFKVELAKTPAQWEQGLMDRQKLDPGAGMLFIFDKEGGYPFWMKNTLIALDMVWIDSSNKVVFISQNAQPCKSLVCPSIVPNSKAKYVLEINAGICQEMGLKLGDLLDIAF